MKSSRAFPCRASGAGKRDPFQQIFPRERKRTLSHTSVTSCMLCVVQRTPILSRRLNSRISRGCRWRSRVERRRRLVEEEEARAVDHRLGEADARLLSGRQEAELDVPHLPQVETPPPNRRSAPQVPDFVQQAEEAEVLGNGQVSGQGGVYGGEIRAVQRPRPVLDDVHPFDPDRPAGGGEDPEIMLMVVVFPAPLGPRSPTICPVSPRK